MKMKEYEKIYNKKKNKFLLYKYTLQQVVLIFLKKNATLETCKISMKNYGLVIFN